MAESVVHSAVMGLLLMASEVGSRQEPREVQEGGKAVGSGLLKGSSAGWDMWEPADSPLTFQAHHTLLLGSGHVGLRNLGNTVRAILLSVSEMVGGSGGVGADLGKERAEALRGFLSLVSRNNGSGSPPLLPLSPLLQCFLNAVLQCLSSTRPLRDFCLRRDFRQEVPGGGRAQELTEGAAAAPAPTFPVLSLASGTICQSWQPQPSSLAAVSGCAGAASLEVVFYPLSLPGLASSSQ